MSIVEAADNPNQKELMIVSVTPQNLERGALWFSEHTLAIKKARTANIWWQQNSFIIETDLTIKPYELAERLQALGYERSNTVAGRGLFTMRGGVLDLWPINTETPYLIEFAGNIISIIQQHIGRTEVVTPRPKLTRTIDDLPIGNFVVHVDHGIGIFRGLSEPIPSIVIASKAKQSPNHDERLLRQQLPRNDTAQQFFIIEYAPPSTGGKPDRLLVPIERKDRLAPYIAFETPHIHRLGGTIWQTTKRKAKENAE